MENRLVRLNLAHPDVLSAEQLRKLRYLLNFAKLADFSLKLIRDEGKI